MASRKEGNKEEGDGGVKNGGGRGGEKAATLRVIARISKCVYKLGHRRVCSLIRHSDAEERGEEERGREEEEEEMMVGRVRRREQRFTGR